MKRTKKNGFSLLEVIAAVVILAVVAAATVATVAPMRAKSETQLNIQDAASLNAMAQTFYLENGRFPGNINALVTAGYLTNNDAASQTRLTKLRRFTYDSKTGTFTAP